MSWDQDRDHKQNMNHSTYGFSSMSAAFIPRSTARGIRRFILAVLIIAGLLGAGFAAMQCARVIAHVITDSRSHPSVIHHVQRKDR
jgi:hypothetical protein